MYEPLHIISIEKFEEFKIKFVESNEIYRDYFQPKDAKLHLLLDKFPYSIIVEGSYDDHDFASKWCWENFGPKDGECFDGEYQEWVGCPLVKKTAYVQRGYYKKGDKNVNWSAVAYKDVGSHSHEGNWSILWMVKSGYDYGIAFFCFLNENDRNKFAAAVPTLEKIQQSERKNMTTEVICPEGVFQSRWGFHPCDRETDKKMRFLNNAYAEALRAAEAWRRWYRKEPQNRVQKKFLYNEHGQRCGQEIVLDKHGQPVKLLEPLFNSLFHVKVQKWGRIYLEDNLLGGKILEASRKSRKPCERPEDVEPLAISKAEIDRLYQIAIEEK